MLEVKAVRATAGTPPAGGDDESRPFGKARKFPRCSFGHKKCVISKFMAFQKLRQKGKSASPWEDPPGVKKTSGQHRAHKNAAGVRGGGAQAQITGVRQWRVTPLNEQDHCFPFSMVDFLFSRTASTFHTPFPVGRPCLRDLPGLQPRLLRYQPDGEFLHLSAYQMSHLQNAEVTYLAHRYSPVAVRSQ